MLKHLLAACFIVYFLTAEGQQDYSLLRDSGWSVHFQITGIVQGHPAFNAPYAGQNSLDSNKESAFSVTSTFFLGRKLWKGASIFFNPEMSGGRGIGSTLGIAGFPNGETFRIGDREPVVYVARFFLRQHFAIGHSGEESASDAINQVNEKIPTSRITLSLGKFGLADFFDEN